MRMVFCEHDSTNVCDERRRMRCQSAVKTKLAMIVLSGLVAGCAPKSPYLPKEYDPAAVTKSKACENVTVNWTRLPMGASS